MLISRVSSIGSLLIVALLATAAVADDGEKKSTTKEQPPAGWQSEAEEGFYLPRGTGRSLMSEEEWREHRQKMRSLSAEEREKYRAEWHAKMMERAKERGVELPPKPRKGHGPPHGMGGHGHGEGKGQGSGPPPRPGY